MPAWVKKAINKRTLRIAAGTTTTIETDPAYTQELAAADEKQGYLNIEAMDANISVAIFRFVGARPDLLRRVDPPGTPFTTVTGVGITEITWSTPTGAASQTRLDITISAGSGSLTLELDDVYRVRGG